MKFNRCLAGLSALLALTSTASAQTAISHVHNAPGWLSGHAYAPASGPRTRVVNGAGWNGTSHVPYQPLNAYELTSGACTSAAAGGPSGTGSSITDGTCTWKYLSGVDYVTLTGWANDSPPWAAGSLVYHQMVVSDRPLRAYMQLLPAGCISTVAPTGTSTNFKTSDGCQWSFIANITYTSGVSHIPYETFPGAPSDLTYIKVNITHPYQATLWNDREYLSGANGEASPILIANHSDRYNDLIQKSIYPPSAPWQGWPLILTTAPGDSFVDSLVADPSLPLGSYNFTIGVGIRGTGRHIPGIEIHDNAIHTTRLQFKSDDDWGVGGLDFRSCNVCVAQFTIIEGQIGTTNWGGGLWFANDLFIAHGRTGIFFDYPGTIVHSTVICPAANCTVGLQVGWDWVTEGQFVGDVAFFGFSHALASYTKTPCPSWQCITWHAANNITDSPGGDAGMQITSENSGQWGSRAYVYDPPGITYTAPAAAAFLGWPGNYRINAASPLHGAGAAYGPFNACNKDNRCPMTADTPDILGTPRPQNGKWDVGAFQTKDTARR